MTILVADMATHSTAKKFATNSPEQRGEVLGILKQLLAERQDDAVVELVSKLVAQNAELQQQPASLAVDTIVPLSIRIYRLHPAFPIKDEQFSRLVKFIGVILKTQRKQKIK